MEGAEFTSIRHFRDGIDIFIDTEFRIPAVRRIDQDLKKVFPKLLVGGFHKLPALANVVEGLELTFAQKFDVPMLYPTALYPSLFISAKMHADILSHGLSESSSRSRGCLQLHPLLYGSRCDLADAVPLGYRDSIG